MRIAFGESTVDAQVLRAVGQVDIADSDVSAVDRDGGRFCLPSGVADDEPAAAQGAFEEKYGVPEVGVPGVGDAVEVDVL